MCKEERLYRLILGNNGNHIYAHIPFYLEVGGFIKGFFPWTELVACHIAGFVAKSFFKAVATAENTKVMPLII